MENIIKELTLSLDGTRGDQVIETKENDFKSRFIVLGFTSRGAEFEIPANAELRFNLRRPGGDVRTFSTSRDDSILSVDGNSVTIEIPGDEVSRRGPINCDVSILSEGKKLTSESFRMIVNPCVGSAQAFSESESVDVLSSLIAEAENAAEDVETLVAEIRRSIENGDFDGAEGQPGWQGADGVSPTVSTTAIGGGHRVTITDAGGAHSFDVLNGANGRDGQNGTNGADGVSPTVSTTAIGGGHRVTITDAGGAHSFDVLNGANGRDGQNGTNGADYTITQNDYASIAQVVLGLLPIYDGTVQNGGS